MSQNKLSAKTVKQTLWETLQALKQGEIPVQDVAAIASVSREIIRCTNTQLKVAVHTGRPLAKEVVTFVEN